MLGGYGGRTHRSKLTHGHAFEPLAIPPRGSEPTTPELPKLVNENAPISSATCNAVARAAPVRLSYQSVLLYCGMLICTESTDHYRSLVEKSPRSPCCQRSFMKLACSFRLGIRTVISPIIYSVHQRLHRARRNPFSNTGRAPRECNAALRQFGQACYMP